MMTIFPGVSDDNIAEVTYVAAVQDEFDKLVVSWSRHKGPLKMILQFM